MGINSKSYYQLDSTKREKVVKGNRSARHRKMEEENLSEHYVKFIKPKRRIKDVRSSQTAGLLETRITERMAERSRGMRLIDADKLDFSNVFVGASEFASDCRESAKMIIDAAPTVDAEL